MNKTIHWIKEHPLIIVLVIGVSILFLLVFSGGGAPANSTATVNGPSDAAVQAAAGLQAAQLQANLGSQQISAQVAGKESDNSTAIALGTIQANAAMYTSDLQAALGITEQKSQENIQLAGIAAQTQLADIAANTNIAQIKSTVDIAALNAGTYLAISNNDAETEQYRIAAAASVANAPYDLTAQLYSTLGSAGLDKLITGAEATKGAVLQLPGISVGRVGSAGGSLFGNTFGNSSAGSAIASVAGAAAYGFQKGMISLGAF